MRAALHNGKLIPPDSLTRGLQRRKELYFEIDKIRHHLGDPNRQLREDYDEWCRKAAAASHLFRKEFWQLERWIEGELLRQAHGVLKTLREEDALEDDELEVLKHFDEYFK